MKIVVKTTDPDWLKKALQLYTDKKPFTLIDDKKIGLTPNDVQTAVNLIKAAKRKDNFSIKDIMKVLASLGVSGIGVWMIVAAIMDPEPTSKLGILLAGGVALAFTGSLALLFTLGANFSVKVKVFGGEFEIKPKGNEK